MVEKMTVLCADDWALCAAKYLHFKPWLYSDYLLKMYGYINSPSTAEQFENQQVRWLNILIDL